MILPVLQYPDERLRQVSQPVPEITDEIRKLASDMLETMYKEDGIGLAAPQVGHFVRMVVIDLYPYRDEEEEAAPEPAAQSDEAGQSGEDSPAEPAMPLVLINPELTLLGGMVKSEEGCLSVPNDYRASVPRHEMVYLKALGLDGNPVELTADGLLAVCLQHECDHLDGKLFIDYISRLKLSLYKASLRKQNKG